MLSVLGFPLQGLEGFGGAPTAMSPIVVNAATEAGQLSGWAAEQVHAAIAMGLVPTNLQSNYQNPITRAEFTALAVALYEIVTGSEITERATFDDTNDLNVQKMGGLGIVSGVGNGYFNPNDTLTREQAAAILVRLANLCRQQPNVLMGNKRSRANSISRNYERDGERYVFAAGSLYPRAKHRDSYAFV
jgi:hypothetical protein